MKKLILALLISAMACTTPKQKERYQDDESPTIQDYPRRFQYYVKVTKGRSADLNSYMTLDSTIKEGTHVTDTDGSELVIVSLAHPIH